jgi:hypothetical protein
MLKNTKKWLVFILTSAALIALMLCFAQAAYGINQQMNEKEIEESIIKKTGFAAESGGGGGGSNMGAIMAMIIGYILSAGSALLYYGEIMKTQAKTCDGSSLFIGTTGCVVFFIIGIILMIAAMMMMQKASDTAEEAETGKRRETTDWSPGDGSDLYGNVEKQAKLAQA